MIVLYVQLHRSYNEKAIASPCLDVATVLIGIHDIAKSPHFIFNRPKMLKVTIMYL